MIQYNSVNVKLFNSQLNMVLKYLWIFYQMWLVNLIMRLIFCVNYYWLREVSRLRKAFANNLSVNIKLSKTQLSKIVQSGGFLGSLLGPLLKIGLPLMKNALKPLAKSVLISLESTAATSATDAEIHKKVPDSRMGSVMLTSRPSDLAEPVTLIILNEKIDIMKIVNCLLWFD